MAVMFPEKCNENSNSTEKNLFNKLKLGLSKDSVCYHNYDISTKETDFMVVLPNKGIGIIEVKSWIGNRIEQVIDNNKIEYLDYNNQKEIYKSPLKQCKSYCHSLIDKLKEKGINVKVVPIVCFPNMTENIYYEKKLDVVSPRERTILYDDLDDISQLDYVIEQKLNNYIVHDIQEFTDEIYIEVCSAFETKETIMKRLEEKHYNPREIRRLFTKAEYSILSYITQLQCENSIQKLMEYYFSKWIIGTKIIIILEKYEYLSLIVNLLEELINNEVPYLNDYYEFSLNDNNGQYKGNIFNFEIYYDEKQSLEEVSPFELVDGINFEKYLCELKKFDLRTKFNLNQYEIEHASSEGNILVKAGAGTGKTYSMVSRVAYLCYVNNYKPEDILKSILMITFTNEAADNMRIRLKKYYTSLAILTENQKYISIMEKLSLMKISTIDSLEKVIIEKFSTLIGVGNSISITTEVFESRREIIKELNLLINTPQYMNILSMHKKYEIYQLVELFLNLLNKNKIVLNRDFEFEEVVENQELFKLIKELALTVKIRMLEENIVENKVNLNNLTLLLNNIIDKLEEEENIHKSVKYVFIDEFQDTDDMTINLIQRFYHIFKFNLFVVGDIKQSIYRFRGADDEAFTKFQSYIREWNKSKLTNKNFYTLNKNYRTTNSLLGKLDKLFESWDKPDCRHGRIFKYDNSDKLVGTKENEEDLNDFKNLVYRDENFEEKLVESINNKINLINENNDINDKKNYTIAILVRDNKQVEIIRRLGVNRGIFIETDKVDNLYQMEPAIDLYRLVLGLQHNKNSKYLYGLSLSNYAATISAKVVYKNRFNSTEIINAFMQNKIIKNWAHGKRCLKEDTILELLKSQPIIRVIRKIINETRPWEQYAEKFSDENKDKAKLEYKRNLDLLLEQIVKSSNSEYITINSLERFLNIMIIRKQHLDARSIEEQNNNVRIKCLTVHKSKGLEYEHVIIPYTINSLETGSSNEIVLKNNKIHFKLSLSNNNRKIQIKTKDYYRNSYEEKVDKIKEEVRILYVALTRAQKTITWFSKSNNIDRKISWTTLLKGDGCN